jgi:hypothetical protein
MCAVIRFITDTGFAPDIDLPLDFVPADICAAAIRHISRVPRHTGMPIIWPAPHRTPRGSPVDRPGHRGFAVRAIAASPSAPSRLRRPRHRGFAVRAIAASPSAPSRLRRPRRAWRARPSAARGPVSRSPRGG